ncbi:MAG: DUF1735 domain-containing protein [Rikenellaceae bacterium]
MKVNKIIGILAAAFAMGACEYEYPNQIDFDSILSDVSFSESNIQVLETVTNKEVEAKSFEVIRTEGVSKVVTIDLEIDQTKIDDYNTQNSSNYELLDPAYYTMPSQVVFEKDSKSVDVDIEFKASLLAKEKGDDASNYILPIKVAASDMLELNQYTSYVMYNLQFSEPMLTVKIPTSTVQLEYIESVDISQEVQITFTPNVDDFDKDALGIEVDQDYLDQYNQANGTSFITPSAQSYSLKEVLDGEDGAMIAVISVNGKDLDASNSYILPVRLTNTLGYDVVQTQPVMINISVVDKIGIAIWYSDALVMRQSVKNTFTETINVSIGSAIVDDIKVEFAYNESLIDSYNSANSTSYLTLPAAAAASISLSTSAIAAGGTYTSVSCSIDIADLDYDYTQEYLIPLQIDTDIIPDYTAIQSDDDVFYLVLARTPCGQYTATESTGYLWDGTVVVAPSINKHEDYAGKGEYCFAGYGGNYGIFDYLISFNITDEPHDTIANCLKIAVVGAVGSPSQTMVSSLENSYLNTETGEIIIDTAWENSGYEVGYETASTHLSGQSYYVIPDQL